MQHLTKWGPVTVLAVAATLLLLAGGVVNVIVDDAYTYRAFLDDIKYLAAAALAAAGVGRGLIKGAERLPANGTTRRH